MTKKIISMLLAILMFGNSVGGVSITDTQSLTDSIVMDYLKREGIVGYLYDVKRHYFYTAEEPWQHVFGFNDAYDFFAPFVVMYYDTVTFEFNYDHKDWRIQLWKGQYGWVFIGSEIGIYTKPERRPIDHYDSPDKSDWLGTSMKLTRFGFWKQFETSYDTRWWCSGFVPGSLALFTWRDQLKLEARITVKDEEMLKAFTKSIEKRGCEYTTVGLDVYIKY